jgi:hypothetical protein
MADPNFLAACGLWELRSSHQLFTGVKSYSILRKDTIIVRLYCFSIEMLKTDNLYFLEEVAVARVEVIDILPRISSLVRQEVMSYFELLYRTQHLYRWIAL